MISAIGIAVGTMALIIVLSVFNGFEKIVLSLFDSHSPDIEITVKEGKSFHIDEIPVEEIKDIPGVLYVGEIVEESAMLTYRNRQHLVRMKGVCDNYFNITGIDTMMTEGDFQMKEGGRDLILLGHGVAYMLNSSIHDIRNFHNIYVPKRGRQATMHPSQAFNASSNYVGGIFRVQPEFDMEYIIVPIRLARSLLEYDNRTTSIAIGLDETYNHRRIQRAVTDLTGENFNVRNRYQQQEFLYKIMRSEKWAIFLILSFILAIAAFNIVGSLTMLVIEKSKDIKTLWFLGANKRLLKNIFIAEGLFVSIGGALIGMVLGFIVCWIQMKFGIISLQADGAFIIEAYPVAMRAPDFFYVLLIVVCIGFTASIIPANRITKILNIKS